jgi:hypothetical protein
MHGHMNVKFNEFARRQEPFTFNLVFKNVMTKAHRTIVLSRAYPSLREEHKLSVPGRVLRKLLGPTSDETEGRRQVRNEGVRDLHCSLNTIRAIRPFRIRLLEHVARMDERRRAHGISVGEPDGKKPLG